MKKNRVAFIVLILSLTLYLIICKVSETKRPIKFQYRNKVVGVFEYEQN